MDIQQKALMTPLLSKIGCQSKRDERDEPRIVQKTVFGPQDRDTRYCTCAVAKLLMRPALSRRERGLYRNALHDAGECVERRRC